MLGGEAVQTVASDRAPRLARHASPRALPIDYEIQNSKLRGANRTAKIGLRRCTRSHCTALGCSYGCVRTLSEAHMDAASPLALLANACCSSRPAPPPAPREGPRYSHSSTTAKSAATADNSAHSSPSTATAISSSIRLPPCAAIAAAPSEPACSPRPLSEAKPSPQARQRCEPPTPHTFAPAPYTYLYRSPCLERNVGSRAEPDRPEGFVVERRLPASSSGTTAVDTPADFSKQTSHHEGRCQDAQATGAQAAAVPRRNPSPGGSEAAASAGLATGLVAPKREDSAPIPKREDSAAGPSPQGESEVEPCGSRHRSESAKPKKELKDSSAWLSWT